MPFELFIASRLRLARGDKNSSASLNVALVGVVLAIVIMILSVVIVMGFKNEITNKIYHLDSHVKVNSSMVGRESDFDMVRGDEVIPVLTADQALTPHVASMSLMADKPAILKTDNDFKGIIYRGVDKNYDWSFIEQHLVEGRVPHNDTAAIAEIVMSRLTASQLGVKTGDKILTYFIDNSVKMRRSRVVGIFNTDFSEHDKSILMGNLAQIQSVNNWEENQGNYVGVNLKDVHHLDAATELIYTDLAQAAIDGEGELYRVTEVETNNQQFFTWLQMLDMNVAIILVLMFIVSGFTLIAALLMIVLERISMVGLLKTLGAAGGSVRRIFIYLTYKLIFKAIIIGNVLGLGLALIQQHFHVLKLDPEAYYMPYVPISIDPVTIIILNVAIIVVSFLTLLLPSFIISSIKPSATMRFE